MKVTVGIRTDAEAEVAGLDISEHGMWGYPEFYIPVPGGYGTESHGHLLGHGTCVRGNSGPREPAPEAAESSRCRASHGARPSYSAGSGEAGRFEGGDLACAERDPDVVQTSSRRRSTGRA
jgi:hypothetical protein